MMAPDKNNDKNHAKDLVLGNGDLIQGGSEPNAKRTRYSVDNVCGSGSSGFCSFQFFVCNDDGLNLSVDLNSDPLDWMRACSDDLRVPQHIHKPMPMELRSEDGSTRSPVGGGYFNADRALQGGFCNTSVSEKIGRSGIDESSAGCIGNESQPELQMVPDGSEIVAVQPEASQILCRAMQTEASQIGAVNEGKELGSRGVEQIAITGIESEPRDVDMADQSVLSNSGEEPGDHQCLLTHEHIVPGVDREPRDVEITDQDVVSGSGQESVDQQCVQAHDGGLNTLFQFQSVRNKDGEVTRNLQVDSPVEKTLEEVNCIHSMIKDFQDKSPRHAIQVKMVPDVKNLRTLKTLARGPFVVQESDTKEKRKSARLTFVVQESDTKKKRKSDCLTPKSPSSETTS